VRGCAANSWERARAFAPAICRGARRRETPIGSCFKDLNPCSPNEKAAGAASATWSPACGGADVPIGLVAGAPSGHSICTATRWESRARDRLGCSRKTAAEPAPELHRRRPLDGGGSLGRAVSRRHVTDLSDARRVSFPYDDHHYDTVSLAWKRCCLVSTAGT